MKKQMRPIDVLAVALGSIIGWGCFVMPGNSFLPAAGPIGTFIGLFLAAVMAWIIAQSYSFLIRKYPVEGGEFEYVTQAFGKKHAFICGWFLVLAYISFIPLNGTAIGLITRYLQNVFRAFWRKSRNKIFSLSFFRQLDKQNEKK